MLSITSSLLQKKPWKSALKRPKVNAFALILKKSFMSRLALTLKAA